MEFEALYAELARGPEIFRALLLGVTPDEARIRPTPESWSILEVVCHLYDEEISDFRPRLDVMLHRPHEPFAPNDPQAYVTERRYNERDLGVMFDQFLTERARSLEWLRGLAEADWEAVYATPWGSLKAGDMFASWVAHDNLHQRQLIELRRARLERLTAPYDLAYAGDW